MCAAKYFVEPGFILTRIHLQRFCIDFTRVAADRSFSDATVTSTAISADESLKVSGLLTAAPEQYWVEACDLDAVITFV